MDKDRVMKKGIIGDEIRISQDNMEKAYRVISISMNQCIDSSKTINCSNMIGHQL